MWTAILVAVLGGLLLWVARLAKLKAEAEAKVEEYRRKEKARENALKGHDALDDPDVAGELQDWRDDRG